jgi:hypothetical protein
MKRDDFEIYFREVCYQDKITNYIRNFEPYIRFSKISNSIGIWKNSRILLVEIQNKIFKEQSERLKSIYASEKNRIDPNEVKVFKEYFKEKYKFYYDLKNKMNDKQEKIHQSYNYNIVFAPLIVSINSEIRFNLKELCDYFQIQFDISIDKGKAFSYSIDLFFPNYFQQQSRYFSYSPYEMTYNELNYNSSSKTASKNMIILVGEDYQLEVKSTEVLRDVYNVKDGFVVNGNTVYLA